MYVLPLPEAYPYNFARGSLATFSEGVFGRLNFTEATSKRVETSCFFFCLRVLLRVSLSVLRERSTYQTSMLC